MRKHPNDMLLPALFHITDHASRCLRNHYRL
jgi:hypothetical protein